MNAKQILKTYFGYDSFRSGQESIINTILSGQDALAIMTTGAGKSICYQVPALLLPGITLVISPLISLMQDQVKALNEAGREGRDGESSQCILLFSAQDIMINKFLLEKKDFTDVPLEDIELIQQRDIRRLQIMEGYCRTTSCLRNYILDYFGEKTSGSCDHCGNCHREYREVDMTEATKWVINCVAETRGRYGQTIVLRTLLDGYLYQTEDQYQNRSEMLNVSGVGVVKFEKYGQRFLNEIHVFQVSHSQFAIQRKITAVHGMTMRSSQS